MERLRAQMEAVEHACRLLEDPRTVRDGESTLMAFRAMPDPYEVCNVILAHSQSPAAQLQALHTIQACALRDWAVPGFDPASLVASVLASLAGAVEHVRPVREAAFRVVAVLTKRGWLVRPPSDHAAFLQSLRERRDCPGQLVALGVMRALVVEFAPTTSSRLGMPLEFHERCCRSLGETLLLEFFQSGLQAGGAAVGALPADEATRVCQAALDLLSACLSWDFRHAPIDTPVPPSLRAGVDPATVEPGPAWRGTLLDKGNLAWIVDACLWAVGGWRGSTGQGAQQPRSLDVLSQGLEVIAQLAVLTGDVFPNDDAGASRATHAAWVISASLAVAWPLEWSVGAALRGNLAAELAVRSVTFVLLQLSLVMRPDEMERAASMVQGDRLPRGLVGLLRDITLALAREGGLDDSQQESLAHTGLQNALDTWVALLQGTDGGAPTALTEAAGEVFCTLVDQKAALGAQEAFDDEDDHDAEGDAVGSQEARGDALAVLGRVAMLTTAPFLAGRLGAVAEAVRAGDPGSAAHVVALEQLCALVQVAAGVLADAVEGETPSAPLVLEQACDRAAREGRPDPAVDLSRALLGVADLALRLGPAGMSPRIMEVLAAALARWADTFLLALRPARVADAFGAQGSGPAVLASTVQLARQLLADYPGESTLHGIVCGKLMTALTRHTRTCGALAGVPEWAAFVGAFAANEPPFAHLPGKLHRKLACCALQAASGLGEAEARGAYLAGLAGPVGAGLAALGGRRLGEGDVQGSGGSQMLLMVERLCGFCQGMEPSMHERLWGLLQPHLGVLLEVQRAAAVNTVLRARLLKLAALIVEAHVVYLSDGDARTLAQWVLGVVDVYRTHAGADGIGAGTGHREQVLRERSKEVTSLLRMLRHLASRNLVEDEGEEGADAGAAPGAFLGPAVVQGLAGVLSTVDAALLRFPKVAEEYTSLAASALESFPQQVSALPASSFRVLIDTLLFASTEGSVEVGSAALEGIAFLLQWHANASSQGKSGLGDLLGAYPQGLPTYLGVQLVGPAVAKGTFADNFMADALAEVLVLVFQMPGLDTRAIFARLCGEDGRLPSASASSLAQHLTDLQTHAATTCAALASPRERRNSFRKAFVHFCSTARGALRVC